jgi:hypothetical protein
MIPLLCKLTKHGLLLQVCHLWPYLERFCVIKPWMCMEIKTNAMCRPEQILSECSIHPITCHEGTEEKWRYSSTLSLTLALVEGGWLMLSPSSFAPRNDPVCICKRLGGPYHCHWVLIRRPSSL